jgi:hypothetical protein
MVAENRSRRLPPKVIGRPRGNRKKVARTPWYRHVAWLNPTVACVIFAVLIAGAVGVRQVIIVLRGRSTESTAAEVETGAGLAAEDGSPDYANDDLLQSSEPGLEVLSPPAAKQPGRKLPKMLIVGRHPGMFPSLVEAMQYAIGGDIIEIRDNGPLYIEPGKAVWEGKEGTLTIRAGKGFQPVLVRDGKYLGGEGMLAFGLQENATDVGVALDGLVFVNLVTPERKGSRQFNRVVVTAMRTQVRRCIFVTDSKTTRFTPGADCVIEDCYFKGFGQSRLFDAVWADSEVVLQNNLIVTLGNPVCMCLYGGRAEIRHNTYVRCGTFIAPHGHSKVESHNNLFIRPTGHFVALNHIAGIDSMQKAQALIEYRGTRNLYLFDDLQFEYSILGQELLSGLSNWQRLTNNGEQKPIFADPKFVNSKLVIAANARILPPKAFALRADSPAKGVGTDGKDIGCDLSKIPVPPKVVEQLIQQALQLK